METRVYLVVLKDREGKPRGAEKVPNGQFYLTPQDADDALSRMPTPGFGSFPGILTIGDAPAMAMDTTLDTEHTSDIVSRAIDPEAWDETQWLPIRCGALDMHARRNAANEAAARVLAALSAVRPS